MRVFCRTLQTTKRPRPKALRTWILVATLALPMMQSCQTLGHLIGAEDGNQDTGLYASGAVDARPARAKLAATSSVPSALPQDARIRAEAVLAQLSDTGVSFDDWVRPLVLSYLPEGEAVTTVIVVDIGLPEPLVTDLARDQVRVDAGSMAFAGKAQTLLSYARQKVVRMVFDRFFARSLALSSAEARDNWLLARLARDGMVQYLTNQGDFRTLETFPARPDKDVLYEALENPWAPYSDKFLALEDRLGRVRSPDLAKTWEKVAAQLEQLDGKSEIFAQVGAYMAQSIERTFGREKLVEALKKGPRAFYDSYQSTRPGALMSFRLPMDAPSGLAH